MEINELGVTTCHAEALKMLTMISNLFVKANVQTQGT